MTERMTIAIEAMKVLIQQDFKRLSFSAKTSGKSTIADYVASESFIFADALIAEEKKAKSDE